MQTQTTPSFSDAERQVWYAPEEEVLPWDGNRFKRVGEKWLAKADRNKAEVWRYRDTQTNTNCAVKIIPIEVVRQFAYTNDTEQPWADIFTAKYLTRVSPASESHFVRWLGCYMDAKFVYYVTELATNGDLWHFMNGAITGATRMSYSTYAARVVFYTRQVLKAVAALHGLRIAHLDLSIENVLVRYDGTIALVDFGMSLMLLVGPGGAFLPVHRPRGKANYQAPEVLSGSYQAMPADVYAVGVMILFLLVTPVIGDYPWNSENPDTWANKSVLDDMRPGFGVYGLLDLLGVPDLLPPELVELLASMLHTDPTQRPTASACLDSPFFRQDTEADAEPNAPTAGPDGPATGPDASGFAATETDTGMGGDEDMGAGF